MPRHQKCSFCGEAFEPGTGISYFTNEGTTHRFCSSKCRKNQKLGRNPIRVRWTTRFKLFREETLGIHKAGEEKAKKVEEPKAEPAKKKPKKEKTISKRKLRKKEARQTK
ncbi:50S ribosomal protein L24e [Candidatus Undinarchaeota archaeon]